MNKQLTATLPALGAAALFGASTPFAKQLIGDTAATASPFLLAGLLYLGSGLGLGMIRLLRDRGWASPGMPRHEWPWLIGAIGFGGVLAPLLLMLGLAHTTASTASLLLNLEAVLTATLAWIIFRENADRRIVFGMLLIVAGGVLLSWSQGSAERFGLGPLAIAGACLAWAIDNNLTRKVSASDALFVAGSKGLVAGCVNTAAGFALGAAWPATSVLLPALLIGFVGYGLSLVLFVLALRGLGTARTGAYFSTAPFVGAAISIAIFGEPTSIAFWIAASLMAAGVWLHLTEHHIHAHSHEALEHAHAHTHGTDDHHDHVHEPAIMPGTRHAHAHQHLARTHAHPHFPDSHHRHSH